MSKTVLRKVVGSKQTRAVEVAPDAVDLDARTVELAFSSEVEYERWFGIEILDHSPGACRLAEKLPLCREHDTAEQLGLAENARIDEDRVGRAKARFSERPSAEYELKDIAAGIRGCVSVGYIVHEMKMVEQREDGPDVYRVTDWEPLEVSIVTVPADKTVGIGRAAEQEEEGMSETETVEVVEETPTPEAEEARAETEVEVEEPAPVEVRESDDEKEDRKRITRIKAIEEVATSNGRNCAADLAVRFIAEGGSPEDYQKELAKMSETTPAPTPEIGLTQKEVREFSFARALRALADPDSKRLREEAAFEFEVSDAARAHYGRERGNITIPHDILKRDLSAGATETGGALVTTGAAGQSMIELLRNKLVVGQLGATILDGLVGDVAIPKQTGGATAYHVKDSAVTESQQTFGQINLTPHTVGAMTDIRRSLLKQSNADVIVQNDLTATLAHGVDNGAINGAGANGEPQGMVNITGIGSSAVSTDGSPTYPELADIWAEVAKDNVNITNGAWLTEAAVYAYMMSTSAASAGGGRMICEDGMLFGYPVLHSEVVATNGIYFGNWSDLVVAMWGGVDLTVDPYTGSSSGTLRIVALQDYDIAARHAQSFAYGS